MYTTVTTRQHVRKSPQNIYLFVHKFRKENYFYFSIQICTLHDSFHYISIYKLNISFFTKYKFLTYSHIFYKIRTQSPMKSKEMRNES
jgi:hypothetical protein